MFNLRVISAFFLICGTTCIEGPKEETTITSYDPGELLTKIFKVNATISSRQRGYGLVFEDQQGSQHPEEDHGSYGLITFEGSNTRLKFEDNTQNRPLLFEDEINTNIERPFQDFSQDNSKKVVFQDDNKVHQGKKRKRRRRKPKSGFQNYQGAPGQIPRPGPPFNPYPGTPGSFGPNPYPSPGFAGPMPFKRRRRPRPSLASDALTAVTGALTSIALYDDLQCVPRLLCEAAGGGSIGANGVLDSIAGIQPLLTVLSAYHGISASPLFVFGRAVFLGMTSRGNTAACRYAYPQCPTDPEQLIHYLNNHNGGFFRFFNAPAPNQNLEQFYNHLGQNGQYVGQDYGQNLGPTGQFNGQYNSEDIQGGYGLYQPQQENYGLYQNQGSFGSYPNHNSNQRPGPYGNQYGSHYDYNTYGPNNMRFKDATKIQKRIQNKPVKDNDDDFADNNENTKLHFPDQYLSNNYDENDDFNDSNSLKFPEKFQGNDNQKDSTRDSKSILFPEDQYYFHNNNNKKVSYSNKQIDYNKYQYNPNSYNQKVISNNHYNRPQNYQSNNNQNVANVNIYKYPTTTPFNENDYNYDYKHKFYVKKDPTKVNHNSYNYDQVTSNYNYKPVRYAHYNNYNNNVNSNLNYNKDASQTVYIVRGNGDPNRPEIVRVRPGQTVH